jgi:hypothetical protein
VEVTALLMALNGPAGLASQCLLIERERACRGHAPTAAFDPVHGEFANPRKRDRAAGKTGGLPNSGASSPRVVRDVF